MDGNKFIDSIEVTLNEIGFDVNEKSKYDSSYFKELSGGIYAAKVDTILSQYHIVHKRWSIFLNNGKVKATAEEYIEYFDSWDDSLHSDWKRISFNDMTHDSVDWYWIVRNRIEQLSSSEIVFEKELHTNSPVF
jgi:hypothetical protein